MVHRCGLSAAFAVFALASSGLAAQPAGPPVAAVRPVVDDYFGAKVTDDYRWMEDRTAPEFVAWAKAENAYARAAIDKIPGRDQLQARIAAHTAGGVAVGSPSLAAGKVFYLKRSPGENVFKLYVRDSVNGPERLLLDPERIPTTGPHYAIDYYQPSPDGRRVVYGVSPGGSENSVIHVLDVASGVEARDAIDRTEQGSPSWTPDSEGFFYNRFVKLAPGANETAKYQNSRAFYHRLGADPESDIALVGTGVPGSPAVTPVDYPFVIATSGSPWAIAAISHGAGSRPHPLRLASCGGHRRSPGLAKTRRHARRRGGRGGARRPDLPPQSQGCCAVSGS